MNNILTAPQIKAIFENRNLKLNDDGRVNLFAFRSSNRIANAFDDAFYTARFDRPNNRWEIQKFRCTTDPGVTQLVNPSFAEAQKHGTAILVEGVTYQFKWSKIGEGAHRHICLTQLGAVQLYRDNNRDNKLDFVNKEVNAAAGICIHCFGNYGETERVNNRSAGCTDFQSWQEYSLTFIPYIKHYDVDGTFSYTVFLESDILNLLK